MLSELLDRIEDEIRVILYTDSRDGANDYAYVRVSPDGTVYSGREPSRCLPINEWERRPPHTVTVWSACGVRPPARPEDGIFEWDEAQAGDEDVFESDGSLWKLSDRLLEAFDLREVIGDIEEELEQYKWLIEEDLTT